ncbi:multidrug ABC transporter ATP-binding protein [Alkalihalobacillus alcalophilus ATCC 27647 = CGMCC 1.3604]|uniref:Multidrug ABC transporter ATP-binding protein n=1 Tax=Alkalihalobacillus alcalophilus ATCC 27647 = CGMCC 1.3604 TaxID=1218173 RepID=J8TMH1_ALKAL|nr:ABC transporter ATP-binding protein [Alkalihalobacillus alcalophilus]AFV25693.1 multidrug transporter [Alkalihalobacillus alcalophilus ATCC 27647 = CGMCC 1.3604]KGA97491.1 multidrug ABC transporter ATP-binding protein [Alkalihalobacillus alcalophilus ATCC 27647 = CGMCC 1.3604]MED1563263.1 ABC transporter ATP-binding protein [Alkalihalobacillus alcalophilus]THG91755.1 multidrug ABC transporter ATP-binding protein [Alkalihalobacillus alcalophilus ATCC 27647 = CGMCC 1.3604]
MLKQLKEPFKYERIPLEQTPPQKQAGQKGKPKVENWYQTIKRVWSYLAVYKLKIFFILLLVVLSSALALVGPFIVGRAVDFYLVSRETDFFVQVLLVLALVYFLHSLTLWLQNFWMVGIAQKTIFTLRTQLVKHLHKLPLPFFDKRQHGELMSRVTNDIENISSTLNSSVIQIFSSVLTFVGIIAVMLFESVLLTVITMLVIPLMFFGMKWITKRTSVFFKEQQRQVGEINGYIEETISGQKIVKTFSQEDRVIREFREKNKKLRRASFWAQTYSGFIPKVMNVLNNLSFAFIAGIGAILALNGHVSVGTIVIFTEYSRQFTRPLNDLANQFNMLLSAVAGAERVFDILDEEEEKDKKEAKQVSSLKGDVEFEQVVFSYDSDQATIAGMSFHVPAGHVLALVGPTGAGKTTIVNLLAKFYHPVSGQIKIDGQDIRLIQTESLRSQMAFVLQDTFLFEATIRENIRYGRLNATDEEVEKAAQLANAEAFIKKMPDGFDTVLDQDGSGISQGQKQLLSIARAILADPAILILDEATSSIDTITEMEIQEALQVLMKERTSFIIAHRLNTIERADKILVIQDGNVIEQGSHEELLAKKGYYANMHGA